MLIIKNDQISPDCHFNKIIKLPGTLFQFPVMSRKHARNVCLAGYYYLNKLLFESAQNSKEISISGNSTTRNAYDDVTDFEIFGFHKNTKIQISQEQNIFFIKLKKFTKNT